MTDVRKEISEGGNDVDLAIAHCKDLVNLLFDVAVGETCVGDRMERVTLQKTGTLLHCLERELDTLEAAHGRMWEAASEATGHESVKDTEPTA